MSVEQWIWVGAPKLLWSLPEMLRPYAAHFAVFSEYLEKLRALAETSDDKVVDLTRALMPGFKKWLENVPLLLTRIQADRIHRLIFEEGVDAGRMRYELHDLRSRLDDELNEEQFLHVPAYLLKYYSALDLFGLEIAEAFISLNEDLENAGKCLAVGQPTACIFHLMRAMEGAVQALCVKLSITNVEREWGKLLSDLHKAIEQMPKSPGRDEWSQVHANLYHVKQAWRNDTMHPKQTYTSEQAEEIFEAVRIFLRQLAGFV